MSLLRWLCTPRSAFYCSPKSWLCLMGYPILFVCFQGTSGLLQVPFGTPQSPQYHFGWALIDSHNDIRFISLSLSPYPEALNSVTPGCKLRTAQPLHYLQHQPPALPVPLEDPVTIQHSTAVTGLFPPGYTYTNDAIALGLRQGF